MRIRKKEKEEEEEEEDEGEGGKRTRRLSTGCSRALICDAEADHGGARYLVGRLYIVQSHQFLQIPRGASECASTGSIPPWAPGANRIFLVFSCCPLPARTRIQKAPPSSPVLPCRTEIVYRPNEHWAPNPGAYHYDRRFESLGRLQDRALQAAMGDITLIISAKVADLYECRWRVTRSSDALSNRVDVFAPPPPPLT